MKKHLLTLSLIIASLSICAQNKNPTTVKGVRQKQKEAQDALNNLTPEQRKMMEQMGISTKVPSMAAGTTDAQVAMAVGGAGVPAKNATFISAIPKITLTASTVASYIKTLNEYVEKGISADAKSFGQQVYTSFKSNKYDAVSIEDAAIGYWTSGSLELGVYMMGRVCGDNGTDADLLSNFAAMLSMGGAPHRAIPLLEYLNKQYPDNTTILNNLGQAWFYLGETDKADGYLEKTVKAFAYHPQANYTQCLIQESKGNTAGAIEKLKNSIKYSYTLDKFNKLRKLGYKIKGSDMRKPFRPDPDPLGLRRFVRPDVPTSYEEELKLKADWDAFQQQVNDKSMSLGKELIPLQQAALHKPPSQGNNIYRQVAERNLEEMNKDGGAGYRLNKAKAAIEVLIKDFQTKDETQRKGFEKQYSQKADKETELAKKGENLGYDNCTVQRKYSEWVYANYNKPLEEAYQNYLHQLHIKITEELYWKQFNMDSTTFEAEKLTAKKGWLAALGSTRYITTGKYGNCATPLAKGSRYKLGDFDDMHCTFISTLDFKAFKQVAACGILRIEFDAGRLSGNLNFKADNKGNDRFINGTLETTLIDKSVSIDKGPIQAGATVKVGAGVEFTSRGVEDVYVTGEASVNTNLVDITASGRMSLISGNMSGGISGFGK